MFLLDTNIISDFVRRPRGAAAGRLATVDPDEIVTSIVVAAELRFGVARSSNARLEQAVEGILSRIEVLQFESPADVVYGSLRERLERSGTPLAANDLLIAAHALTLGCTLVTGDAAFRHVPDLRVENWLPE